MGIGCLPQWTVVMQSSRLMLWLVLDWRVCNVCGTVNAGQRFSPHPWAAACFVPISVSFRTHARVARAQCAARRRLCTRT